jgi:uncharacterized protein DUF551
MVLLMEWIRIDQRLPPNAEWIYIFDSSNFNWGTGMFSQGWWVFKEDYGSWTKPTHWMALHESTVN